MLLVSPTRVVPLDSTGFHTVFKGVTACNNQAAVMQYPCSATYAWNIHCLLLSINPTSANYY